MPSGNITGVTPTSGRAKTRVIWARDFGGVCANSWRPLSLSTFIYTWQDLPDLYVRSGVKFRVIWSTDSSTAADTVTWRVRYRTMTIDSTDLVTTGTTFSALDTTIVADNAVTTANAYRRTAAGVLAPGRLVAGEHYCFEVGVTAASGITLDTTDANVQFFGLELEYAQGSH